MKQRGGTPHITIEVIWSNVQTRLGTPHRTMFLNMLRSWVDGPVAEPMCRLSNVILDPTLALIRTQHGFRIQVRAECGNIDFHANLHKNTMSLFKMDVQIVKIDMS